MSSPRPIDQEDVKWAENLTLEVNRRYGEVVAERKQHKIKSFFGGIFGAGNIHHKEAKSLEELQGKTEQVVTTVQEKTTQTLRQSRDNQVGFERVVPISSLDDVKTEAIELKRQQDAAVAKSKQEQQLDSGQRNTPEKFGIKSGSLEAKKKAMLGSLVKSETKTEVSSNAMKSFIEIVQELERNFIKAFEGETRHGLKKAHGLAKRGGDVDKFVKEINNKKGKHQYLRLAAAALRELYNKYSDVFPEQLRPTINGQKLNKIVEDIQPVTLDKKTKREVPITFDNLQTHSPRPTVEKSLKA